MFPSFDSWDLGTLKSHQENLNFYMFWATIVFGALTVIVGGYATAYNERLTNSINEKQTTTDKRKDEIRDAEIKSAQQELSTATYKLGELTKFDLLDNDAQERIRTILKDAAHKAGTPPTFWLYADGADRRAVKLQNDLYLAATGAGWEVQVGPPSPGPSGQKGIRLERYAAPSDKRIPNPEGASKWAGDISACVDSLKAEFVAVGVPTAIVVQPGAMLDTKVLDVTLVIGRVQ